MLSNQEIALNFIKLDNPKHPLEYAKQIVRPYAYEVWQEELKSCKQCENACFDKKFMPYGNINAPIMIVMTCTTAYIKAVRSFIEQCIDHYNLNQELFFYMPPVCCPFQDNGVERSPYDTEVKMCSKKLKELIEIVSPLAILTTNSYGSALFSNKAYSSTLEEMGAFNQIPVFVAYSIEHILFLHERGNLKYEEKQIDFYQTFVKMITYLQKEYPSLKLDK